MVKQPPVTTQAADDFYDYLSHRADEDLSYQKLARDAARIIDTLTTRRNAAAEAIKTAAAFNQLARPLLRTGALSFRGNGTYGLTATQHIRTRRGDYICINAPFGKTLDGATSLAPGVVRLSKAPQDLPGQATTFDLLSLLRGVPALDELVRSSDEWEEHKRGTPEDHWLLVNSKKPWSEVSSRLDHNRVLVFQTAEESAAPRVLRLDRKLYHIPAVKSNPAAFPLTLLLESCTREDTSKMFVRDTRSMTVTSPYFPAELERALWLGALLETETAVDGFAGRRTYPLPPAHLAQLDRILLR